jgi:DNA-binding NarL/FixJ family response regulator
MSIFRPKKIREISLHTLLSKLIDENKSIKITDEMENIKDVKIIKEVPVYFRIHLRHKLFRIQQQFLFTKQHRNKFQRLTQREREVIKLIGQGNNNPAIAQQLFISRCTVEQHRKNINRKLKIKSFSDLMRYVYAFDLI